MYIDEDFELQPNKSLLLNGKFCRGVTDRVGLMTKEYSQVVNILLFNGCIKHNPAIYIVRISCAYAESTLSMIICR